MSASCNWLRGCIVGIVASAVIASLGGYLFGDSAQVLFFVVPVVAAWTLAWNRWCLPPWRSIDVAAVVLAVAGAVGAVMHLPSVIRGSRLGSIALFVVICARIARTGCPSSR